MCTMPCSLRAWYSAELLAVLEQGLTDARDVAVTEDADRAAEERLDVTVALDPLSRKELNEGLGHGEADAVTGVGHEGIPSASKVEGV